MTACVAGKFPTLTEPETAWVAGKFPTETVPDTGWVLADPSTFNGVIAEAPWTVKTSGEDVPAIVNAGCFDATAAPAGRGADDSETACVAGKLPTDTVPDTG